MKWIWILVKAVKFFFIHKKKKSGFTLLFWCIESRLKNTVKTYLSIRQPSKCSVMSHKLVILRLLTGQCKTLKHSGLMRALTRQQHRILLQRLPDLIWLTSQRTFINLQVVTLDQYAISRKQVSCRCGCQSFRSGFTQTCSESLNSKH